MQQILLRLLSILYSSVEKQTCPFDVCINKDLSHLTPHGSPEPATANGENEAVPSPFKYLALNKMASVCEVPIFLH